MSDLHPLTIARLGDLSDEDFGLHHEACIQAAERARQVWNAACDDLRRADREASRRMYRLAAFSEISKVSN